MDKTEGVLLHSISYLGEKSILKVFTKEAGLLSFIVKKRGFEALSTPFLIGEWVYRKQERELLSLQDGTLLDPLSTLKTNYERLLGAGAIAKTLLSTQWPEKKEPLLYTLTLAYLKKMGETANPLPLVLSFQLKTLLHEGLFLPRAKEPLFLPEEWGIVLLLTYGKSFSELNSVEIEQPLQTKIEQLMNL